MPARPTAEPVAADRTTPAPAPAVPRGAGVRAVVEYQLLSARRFWRSVVIVSVVTPALYVLALGVGLGTAVNRNGSGQLGVPYLQFVAPAFLTSAALQVAAGEAAWPVLGGFKWLRVYHGMAATSLAPRQICDGVLTWIALRLCGNSVVYLAIVAALGGARRGWIVLAVPAAVLTGMAFGAPLAALSASLRTDGQAFNVVFRFIVTPMFLFAGTFYPIDQLPHWARWLAYCSPLWHGTELARSSALGGGTAAAELGHLGYLAAWLVAGVLLARWRFRVRLTE